MHVCVHASVTAVTDSCSEQSRSQRGRCSRAPTLTGWRLSWCCRRSTRASCVWSAPCRGGTSILRAWLSRYGAASYPLPSVPAFCAPLREPSVQRQGSEVPEVQVQRLIYHSRAQDLQSTRRAQDLQSTRRGSAVDTSSASFCRARWHEGNSSAGGRRMFSVHKSVVAAPRSLTTGHHIDREQIL
jgi:hypothetical protein